MNILYTTTGMLYDGSDSRFSSQMYKKITKYYTKIRECCTDINKSIVYLTKERLLTEQKCIFGMIWEGILYGSLSIFYEKETRAKNFAKYHTSSLPTTMPFITACASLLTGIFWVSLGLYPMENSQNSTNSTCKKFSILKGSIKLQTMT
jgi:hypothetical protein